MTALSYAEAARARKASEAYDMGIDDVLISRLVEQFYAAIRTHEMLGPIFEHRVVNWTPHLARMKDFWASIAIESGRFSGNPMQKHSAIPDLTPAHFAAWLTLWDATVADVVTDPAAADLFRDRARRIATSLQTGIALHNGGLAALVKGEVTC